MFLPLPLSLFLLRFALAAPAPSGSAVVTANSTASATSSVVPTSTPEPLAVFTVQSFSAFIAFPGSYSSSPSQPSSSITFQLIDPRPNFALSVTCTLSGKSIYKQLFTACDGGMSHGAKFRVSEGELEIKREWHDKVDQAWITGFAPQGTYWVEGDGGNVTKTEDGKTYTRTEPWAFPVRSAMASW